MCDLTSVIGDAQAFRQGGVVYSPGEYVDNITAAALQFLKNNDPKAGLLLSYGYLSGSVSNLVWRFLRSQ